MAQVFISYSRRDLDFVHQLAADLKKAGLEVWYDVSKLGGGSRWRTEIENALQNSQYVVVVLSPDSIKSEWVEREFIFSNNLNLKIIPLMYRTCKLTLNYVNLNYIDARGDQYLQNFSKILSALDVEAGEETLPTRRPAKIRSRSMFLIGGGTIVIATLLALALIRNTFTPVSTLTDLRESPASTLLSIESPTPEPIEVTLPSPLVTNTLAPATSVPTDTFTPTESPVLAEIEDERGVEMIVVPAGNFMMGNNNGESDEEPVHKVYLDVFYMDKYEVTNVLYKACVDIGVCDPPHELRSTAHSSYFDNPEFDDYPVIYVDWFQSQAYCEWRNASLPTEAQWEKAARGPEPRLYPWGDGIDCGKTNYGSCNSDIVAVGSYPRGISPYGIYDLAGNVWEWVEDWYSESYYKVSPENNPFGPAGNGTHKILRGGTWDSDADNLYTSSRLKYRPAFYTEGIGFRCAKDAIP